MDKEDRIQMARETMQITKQGFYYNSNEKKVPLETENSRSVYAVNLYSPHTLQIIAEDDRDECFKRDFAASDYCTFYLVDADSFTAAQGMNSPLVMNFANAHYPGGAFLNGASAQEESLCRTSTLYASISSSKAKVMYDYNNQNYSEFDSDYMLLSPNVVVFRDEKCNLMDKPYKVGVATVAAPNRNGHAM